MGTGKRKFGAVSMMLLCSILGSVATLDSYSSSQDVEWAASEFPIPYSFDPETDSDVQPSSADISLIITDPELNHETVTAETVTLTPAQDDDDLTIRIEGSGGQDLVTGDEISSCSAFGSTQFVETGANTGEFEATFQVTAEGCSLAPEELANAELIAEYAGRHDSTVFRGYASKLEASAKTIYTGLELTLTVTDHDQNKDVGAIEHVKVKLEPDGLASEFAMLNETGVDTGVFEKKLLVGDDIEIVDDGLVDDVLVRYVDAASSDGSREEKELVLSVQTNDALLTSSPSSDIAPQANILVTLSDKDINKDPDAADIIDYDILRVQTDNDDIEDSDIRLGDDGFELEETDENSGVFELELVLVPAIKLDDVEFSASTSELEVPAAPGDNILVSYEDRSSGKTVSLMINVESFDPVIETDKEKYLPGDTMAVTIKDADANMDSGLAETIEVHVYSDSDPVGNFFSAVETGADTGIFTFEVDIGEEYEPDAIMAELGDKATIEYEDLFPADYDGDKHTFAASVPVGDAVQAYESAAVSEPVVKDINGGVVGNVTVGQYIVLSTEIENALEEETDFVAVMEVRDSEGFTVYFAWQGGTLEPGEQTEVGLTWKPDSPGEYQARTFVLSNLAVPEVLSDIKQSGITVT